MIAQELEVSLHMAFVEARQKRHEFITVEHLLLALLDNPSAAEVLRACAVNIDELRKELSAFINEHTPVVDGSEEIDLPDLLNDLVPHGVTRVIVRRNGKEQSFAALVRLDTAMEVEYFRHGGILHYVLRQMM